MSAIFIPNQSREEPSGVFQDLRNAGVQLIIELLIGGRENKPLEGRENESKDIDFINEEWMVNTFFEGDYENTDTDLVASLLEENVILTERSFELPSLTNLTSFLQKATGVAIGACVGMTAANTLGNRMLLFVTVPFGILIVGTASGVGSALKLGLGDRLLKTLKVNAKSAKRTAKTLPKAGEPDTSGVIPAKDYGDEAETLPRAGEPDTSGVIPATDYRGPLHRIIGSNRKKLRLGG
jgi:hypothetical protein